MKLRKWLYGVMAMSMLTACSDNDFGPDLGQMDDGGEGYMGLRIQLPSVSSTRANDNFDDGEESEYNINDAVILLFQGKNENEAKYTGSFTLKKSDFVKDEETPQVTGHSIRVANVSGIENDTTSNLYGLVMINGVANNFYNLDNPTASWMEGKTIKQFQEEVTKNKLFQSTKLGQEFASNIFMTNSPLSKVGGGGLNPGIIKEALPVLVKLDKTLYKTESDAIANPAGIIHVERAVGKVTCSEFNLKTDLEVKVDGYNYKLTVDTIWWDMSHDMAESYVVRNTNRVPAKSASGNNMWAWNYASSAATSNQYRMLGNVTLAVGDSARFRPYFCQVPGYNVASTDSTRAGGHWENKNFTKRSMEFKDAVKLKIGDCAFYPRENTFPVNYMKYANTTRIGFWVSFKFEPQDGAPALNMNKVNFYINGMDKGTLYLQDKYGHDPLVNLAIAELTNAEKYPEITKAVENALDKDEPGAISHFNIADILDFNSVVDVDGHVKIAGIRFLDKEEIKNKLGEDIADLFATDPTYEFTNSLITRMNNLGQYYVYDGGKVFYEVRIKHFGDDLTPWMKGENEEASTIEESYGWKVNDPTSQETASKNYLGRYGIVRNNWYDIHVDKITHIGYPKDPALWDSSWPGKPDDNRDQYIAVELRVLSWAKRTQHIEF